MRFLSGACFITRNVRGLAGFYAAVLGIAVDANDLHVEIPLEGGSLVLYDRTAAERDMGFDFSEYHGTGLAKISFLVQDVDAEYERLKALDIRINFMTPPMTYPWGARSMHFRDPDGNIVCFVRRAGD